MCDSVKTSDDTNTAHCYVNHINTVPRFSCPLESGLSTRENIPSEKKQLHVSQCAYDSIVYNETTFTINITDIVNPLTCIIRYSAVGNTSVSYAEKHFVVYETQSNNNDEGKYDI